jgi:hypothetical protein
MKERMENPHPEIVEKCCKSCPLLPSKPSSQNVNQNILAAADSASRLKKLIDGKLAQIMFGPNDLSARRCSAYLAYLNAIDKSEENRFKEIDKKPSNTDNKHKIKFRPNDGF